MQLTEKQAAALLERTEQFFDKEGGFPKVLDRLKALEGSFEGFAGLDPQKILEEHEKLRAQVESFQRTIRSSKHGLYVPGAEDVEFSVLRAMLGVKIGWEKAGAQQEFEIMKQARDKALNTPEFKAAMTAGDDESLGLFIPDQVIADVIAPLYTRSVFFGMDGDGMTRVTTIDGLMGSGIVKIPRFDGGLIAYWIGEEDAFAESQAKVGDVRLNPHKLGVLFRLTVDMRDNAGYGLERMLRTDMIRALAKKFDWTIPFGTGGEMPLGVFNNPDVPIYRAETGTTITSAEAADVGDFDGGELDFDGLDDMGLSMEEASVEPDEREFFTVSSPRYFRRLARIKIENYTSQTTGQPYMLGAPMITKSKLAELIGPFDSSNQFPSNRKPGASIDGATDSTTEKYTDVLRGNLRSILVGRWAGIEIEDDAGKGKGFVTEHIYVKGRMRADIALRRPAELRICADARARA